jgi:hypothetical protein
MAKHIDLQDSLDGIKVDDCNECPYFNDENDCCENTKVGPARINFDDAEKYYKDLDDKGKGWFDEEKIWFPEFCPLEEYVEEVVQHGESV